MNRHRDNAPGSIPQLPDAANDTVDDELVRQVSEGDPEAFDRLYERHNGLLRAFCAARVGRSNADDVAQTVWLRIWPYLRTGRYNGRSFRALLITVAKRAIIDQYRKDARSSQSLNSPESVPEPGSDEPIERLVESERAAHFDSALRELEQRFPSRAQIARLRMSGLAPKEIAKQLGVKAAFVHKHWFKAKEFLRDRVADLSTSTKPP
jgi:RNA polymerase sigma-70 factor (ECF subfamily)